MKFATCVLIFCAAVLALTLADITRFYTTGQSLLHPLMGLYLAFSAAGLGVVALAALLERWKHRRQKRAGPQPGRKPGP